MKRRYTYIIMLVTLAAACDRETPTASSPFSQPDHFPAATYTFENNPFTESGFALGRMLFYDPIMSADSTVACVNCHLQAVAFSDPAHAISVGIDERIGTRNAPPIFNLAFRSSFFWDGGVTHIDFIPLNAITNENELAESVAHLVEKLQRHDDYPGRFKKAFGSDSVTSQHMLFALSQFTASMVSATSRYDDYVTGQEDALTAQEIRGLGLFTEKCASCHTPPLFTNDQYANNGLDEEGTWQDDGRAIITAYAKDRGKFKVPSLRNIALTDPYMHDGRYHTLAQVLTHYQQTVKISGTLDPLLLNGDTPGISMTDDDKEDLIAFLHTLTDTAFKQDTRFSNPFLP